VTRSLESTNTAHRRRRGWPGRAPTRSSWVSESGHMRAPRGGRRPTTSWPRARHRARDTSGPEGPRKQPGPRHRRPAAEVARGQGNGEPTLRQPRADSKPDEAEGRPRGRIDRASRASAPTQARVRPTRHGIGAARASAGRAGGDARGGGRNGAASGSTRWARPVARYPDTDRRAGRGAR